MSCAGSQVLDFKPSCVFANPKAVKFYRETGTVDNERKNLTQQPADTTEDTRHYAEEEV